MIFNNKQAREAVNTKLDDHDVLTNLTKFFHLIKLCNYVLHIGTKRLCCLTRFL